MSQIGIKLANHDFFPIIDVSNLPIEKEIELTTIRDGQKTVQINLFKKDGDDEPLYVGSLMIEGLKEDSCGEATINLKLKLDDNNHLSAEATDITTGNKQSFGISIDELDKNTFSTTDFNLDDDPVFKDIDSSIDDVSSLDFSFSDNIDKSDEEKGMENETFSESLETNEDIDDFSFTGLDDESSSLENELMDGNSSFEMEEDNEGIKAFEEESSVISDVDDERFEDESLEDSFTEEKKGIPIWLKILLIIFLLSLLVIGVSLFFTNKEKGHIINENTEKEIGEKIEKVEEASIEDKNPMDELTTESPSKKEEPFPKKDEKIEKSTPEVSKVQEEEKKKERTDGGEKIATVEGNTVKKEVRYRLRWGDTLWDIAQNFYKNPWAYKKIAKYNNIKNPNKIISGTYITIPAK